MVGSRLLNIFKKVTGINTIQNRIYDAIRLVRAPIYKRLIDEYGLSKTEEDKKIAAHVTDSLFYLNPEDWMILQKSIRGKINETDVTPSQLSAFKIIKFRNKILVDLETRTLVVEILKMYKAYHMYDNVKIPSEQKNLFRGIDPQEWLEILISEFLKKYQDEFPDEPDMKKVLKLPHDYWIKYGEKK